MLRSFGRDVEAVVDSTGKETGAVVVRKARKEESGGEEAGGAGVGSSVKPARRVKKPAAPVYEATSDLVLIRAAVVGGLVASIATLLLNTVIHRYAPTPSSKP